MSVDGPLAAAYVNPGGFVHDTLTVTEAVNLRNRELMVSRLRWTRGGSRVSEWGRDKVGARGAHAKILLINIHYSLKPIDFIAPSRTLYACKRKFLQCKATRTALQEWLPIIIP